MTYWISYYIKPSSSNILQLFEVKMFQTSFGLETRIEYVGNSWYKVTRKATTYEISKIGIQHVVSLEATIDEMIRIASMEVARRNA